RQSLGGTAMSHQLDRAGRMLLALDEALFLQSLEVTHDPVRRLDFKRFADFPHSRPVAAALDLQTNELVNLSLPLGQLAEVRHGSSPLSSGAWRTSESSSPANRTPSFDRRAFKMY